MTITVSAGVTTGGLTISAGDPLVVRSAGTVSNTTILGGGSATLSSGGTGEGLTVSSGGMLSGLGRLTGSNSVSGTVSGLTLLSSSTLEIAPGGLASGVTASGLLALDPGSTATKSLVVSGGEEEVFAGATGSGDTIGADGVLVVESGGILKNERVTSGGNLLFLGYLSGSNTLSANTQTSPVEIAGATVSSGGMVTLEEPTLVSGATLNVSENVIVYGITVAKGAVLMGSGELLWQSYVSGQISGVSVVDSGLLEITSGGAASDVTAESATMHVNGGASATGTTLSAAAELDVFGSATATTISSTAEEFVSSGGNVSADIVMSGGKQIVRSGGVARGTTVTVGGAEDVLGQASATVTSSGGKVLVSAGGAARGTVVLRGGTEYVFSRGVTVAPTVSSGGHETVSVGGFASGITLLSGGVLTDDGETRIVGGGTLAGTLSGAGSLVVAGAGDLLLSGSGAAFAGRALIEGGTLELAKSGALGTGFVEFAAPASGSAVLQIDAADAPAAGGTFANVLSNFSAAGEDIDLPSIAFVAGAATNAKIVGSTLVLTEGGKTYKFTVAGSTAGAYPVLSDGHGGTLIDPEAARFAQTAAAFAPPPAAKTALARGSATGQTPFLHAAVSAGAARP